MAKITGRTDDMMIIRGVNVFPSQIEEQILALEELSPHYQLELYQEGHLDQLRVLVELQPDKRTLSSAKREGVAHELEHNIKSYVGLRSDVEVLDVGSVPSSQGQDVRVVDKGAK